MKTTLEISDALLIQAKRFAAKHETTLRSLVEQGLRRIVMEKLAAEEFRLRRVTYKGRGLQAAVRNAGWDRLREMAYEERGG